MFAGSHQTFDIPGYMSQYEPFQTSHICMYTTTVILYHLVQTKQDTKTLLSKKKSTLPLWSLLTRADGCAVGVCISHNLEFAKHRQQLKRNLPLMTLCTLPTVVHPFIPIISILGAKMAGLCRFGVLSSFHPPTLVIEYVGTLALKNATTYHTKLTSMVHPRWRIHKQHV